MFPQGDGPRRHVARDRLVPDSFGRIQQKVETIGGATTTYDYGYDAANRLYEVKQNGVVVRSWDYDEAGNRKSETKSGITVAPTYDAQDRLQTYGAATYAFGKAGDLQSRTDGTKTTNYLYDALGNLISAQLPDGTQLDYVMDAQGRRVGKKVNGRLVQGFLWESQLRVAAELDGSGKVVSRFVYGTKVNVPELIIKGSTTYRVITDHLGSPRLVVNTADGTVAQRMDYDEWGNVLADSQPGFQPFGFAGGLYERDLGLVRFGARDYEPMTGRWTAKDPARFAGGSNLFAYSANNPLHFEDPNGLYPLGGFPIENPPGSSPVEMYQHMQQEHYNRNQYNADVPYDFAVQNWEKMSDALSIYHRFGPGNEHNEKLISPCGHKEDVYRNGQLVKDPANLGTYNFQAPRGFWGSLGHFP